VVLSTLLVIVWNIAIWDDILFPPIMFSPKIETLQSEYNKLTQAHFKTHNDLKTLHIDLDWFTRDYSKVVAINVQWEKTMLELENTYLQ